MVATLFQSLRYGFFVALLVFSMVMSVDGFFHLFHEASAKETNQLTLFDVFHPDLPGSSFAWLIVLVFVTGLATILLAKDVRVVILLVVDTLFSVARNHTSGRSLADDMTVCCIRLKTTAPDTERRE
ncbi:hypothetical protein GF324_13500 [bacterium]|nr:hypothetical protein [bacterium]